MKGHWLRINLVKREMWRGTHPERTFIILSDNDSKKILLLRPFNDNILNQSTFQPKNNFYKTIMTELSGKLLFKMTIMHMQILARPCSHLCSMTGMCFSSSFCLRQPRKKSTSAVITKV